MLEILILTGAVLGMSLAVLVIVGSVLLLDLVARRSAFVEVSGEGTSTFEVLHPQRLEIFQQDGFRTKRIPLEATIEGPGGPVDTKWYAMTIGPAVNPYVTRSLGLRGLHVNVGRVVFRQPGAHTLEVTGGGGGTLRFCRPLGLRLMPASLSLFFAMWLLLGSVVVFVGQVLFLLI